MPLPEYKPGDYLECGEGEGFSRVLVLSENNVLIKSGVATGSVITMDEWYFIVGEARETIQNTTYFDSCKGCPYYVSDPICGDPSIESIGSNSIGSNSIGSNSIGSNSTGRKSCIRTSSTSSIRSVTINSQPTVIERQTTLRNVKVPPEHPKHLKVRNWSDWFGQVFLCGLID
jgi:hypothetical protein